MRALTYNMGVSRTLKCLHIVGMRFSRESYANLGEGIAEAKSLKKLILNQTNIGTYGLNELAAGFQ
jgi:hypothetical protein